MFVHDRTGNVIQQRFTTLYRYIYITFSKLHLGGHVVLLMLVSQDEGRVGGKPSQNVQHPYTVIGVGL